ncbi:MAG: nucleotidyltransferase substrate binding protein [Treponemataceae bacterium]|nr:MAG: nucleotidyltransferase substrate binding protein [Treponemataceae bacterium]
MDKDIRWKQRFRNYEKALLTLQNAVELSSARALTVLEKQGLIQGFEFTFELAWNVMKDYLAHQGITGIIGSKDAVRQAYKNSLISDGQIWMDMIEGRNLAAHSYSEEISDKLGKKITEVFFAQFAEFAAKMKSLGAPG